MVGDEYVQLMYFYRSFFKEIFGEAMDLMGRRGILAILRTSSLKYAKTKLENFSTAQKSFTTAVKLLLDLGRPEIYDEGSIVLLKRCPFKTRPTDEDPCLEEDVFCNICVGFLNGISSFFNFGPMRLVASRIRRSKSCQFIR